MTGAGRRLKFENPAQPNTSGDVCCLIKLTVLFSCFSVSYHCHLQSVMLPKYHDSSHEALIYFNKSMLTCPCKLFSVEKKIIKDLEDELIAVELSFA